MSDALFVKFSNFDHRFCQVNHFFNKLIVNVFMDVDTGRLHAELASIVEAEVESGLDSGAKIGVFADYERIFPPSSKLSLLRFTEESRMIFFPVAVLPVNAIFAMPGWSTIAWPASCPNPGTILTTPGGTPFT